MLGFMAFSGHALRFSGRGRAGGGGADSADDLRTDADRAVVCKNWETKNRQEKKKHELLFHKMGCFREYAFTLPEMKII